MNRYEAVKLQSGDWAVRFPNGNLWCFGTPMSREWAAVASAHFQTTFDLNRRVNRALDACLELNVPATELHSALSGNPSHNPYPLEQLASQYGWVRPKE
jgi:hypothetical protein